MQGWKDQPDSLSNHSAYPLLQGIVVLESNLCYSKHAATLITISARPRRAIVVLESNLGYTNLHDLLLRAGDRRWAPGLWPLIVKERQKGGVCIAGLVWTLRLTPITS